MVHTVEDLVLSTSSESSINQIIAHFGLPVEPSQKAVRNGEFLYEQICRDVMIFAVFVYEGEGPQRHGL
jgi:hypothetical protein